MNKEYEVYEKKGHLLALLKQERVWLQTLALGRCHGSDIFS